MIVIGGGLVGTAVADDFIGATDLANNLVRAGMRVVQTSSNDRKGLRKKSSVPKEN
jgi:uncharacterized protein YgbK (DUF1537 family)